MNQSQQSLNQLIDSFGVKTTKNQRAKESFSAAD